MLYEVITGFFAAVPGGIATPAQAIGYIKGHQNDEFMRRFLLSMLEKLGQEEFYGLCTRITSYNVCYTKLLRAPHVLRGLHDAPGPGRGQGGLRAARCHGAGRDAHARGAAQRNASYNFV